MKRTKPSKKPITTASRKAKGRELQKWVGNQISKLTGFEFGPDKPIESRGMGQSGTDVRMESQVLDLFPFSVECKAGNSAGLWAAIKQAKENQIDGTDWLVVLRRDHMEAIVAMDAEVFFSILIELKSHGGKL